MDEPRARLTVHRQPGLGAASRAHLLIGAHPPLRLSNGHVLEVPVPAGTHQVRLRVGGARSHTIEVDVAPAQALELHTGLAHEGEPATARTYPALLPGPPPQGGEVTAEGRQRQLRVAQRDGVAFDDSSLPFWAFVCGLVAPVIGLVVVVGALRRTGMGTLARALVWVGFAAAVAQLVAVVVVVLRFYL